MSNKKKGNNMGGDDSAISKLIGKMVEANQSTLEAIMETEVRKVVREELDFYFDKLDKKINEALQGRGGSQVISEQTAGTMKTDNFETPAFDEDLDYDMNEIRKRLSEKHNPLNRSTVNETLQGQGNANKIADEQGNMVDVPDMPEIDKKIKRDYSDFI